MEGIISNIITDKQDIKNQLGNFNSVIPVVRNYSENLGVNHLAKQVFQQPINSTFIIGNPSNSSVATTKLHNDMGQPDLVYVVVPNDRFITYYDSSLFILPSSTGTQINSTYEFTAGDELNLDCIYKTKDYIIKIQIESLTTHEIFNVTQMKFGSIKFNGTFGGRNLIVNVSNDLGTTWNELTNVYSEFVFPTTSNLGVMVKFKPTEDMVFDVPMKIKING